MNILHSFGNWQTHKITITKNDTGFIIAQDFIENIKDLNNRIVDGYVNYLKDNSLLNLESEILFSDVQNRIDLADHTAYAFPQAKRLPLDGHQIVGSTLYNVYTRTYNTKEDTRQLYRYEFGTTNTFTLIIPFKNSPVSDWTLAVNANSADNLVLNNCTSTLNPYGGGKEATQALLPKISFGSSTASGSSNSTITLPFTVKNGDNSTATNSAEIYFENFGGYLPLTRQTVTGSGNLLVSLRDVPSGSSFKVKAGFKNFTGAAECSVTVS